jgi:hypothetical protein
MIRQGHSPYFVKYGAPRRHAAVLAAAEDEARRARRGIWGQGGPAHYPDYEERRAWWRERAEQVARWRSLPDDPRRIELESREAPGRLLALEGREAVVFGCVVDRREEGRPRILWLRHVGGRDFPVVVFEERVWRALDHAALDRRYATVRGRVGLHRGRAEIVVEDARAVSTE